VGPLEPLPEYRESTAEFLRDTGAYPPDAYRRPTGALPNLLAGRWLAPRYHLQSAQPQARAFLARLLASALKPEPG
jgi:hypothetical protein